MPGRLAELVQGKGKVICAGSKGVRMVLAQDDRAGPRYPRLAPRRLVIAQRTQSCGIGKYVGLWIGMADARLLPRHRAASISIYRYRILEPMHMDGLYGTIQPFAGQRLRRRWPGARKAEFSGCP